MHCIVFVASLRPQWCLLQLQWRRQDLHFTEDKFNNGIFHLAHSCQRKMPSHGRLTKLKRNKTSALNTREVKDSPLIYMQWKLASLSAYFEPNTKRERGVMQTFYNRVIFQFKWKFKRWQTNTKLKVNSLEVPFGRWKILRSKTISLREFWN